MNNKNYVLIEGTLSKRGSLTSNPKIVSFKVTCKDEYAVVWFSDKSLAKKLTKIELKNGKKVTYNKELNVMIEKFKGLSALEISEKLKKELNSQGGEIKSN